MNGPVTSTIAVDWSGAADDRGANLWLAHCVGGELVELAGGWSRRAVIDRILALSADHPGTAVGLDFSFGFPAWFVHRNGWGTAAAMWGDVATRGETWLRTCEAPFWGRPGRHRGGEEQFRRTERRVASRWSVQPKSTFQIGGAGSVGTGSLRGMPHLLTLRAAGCVIWPFDSAASTTHGPVVVELYPRLFTGAVVKRNRAARLAAVVALTGPFTPTSRHLSCLETAVESEDAFDAALSALGMYANRAGLAAPSPEAPFARTDRSDPVAAAVELEGEIWQPAQPPVA